ncbi:MAG: outer membrane beta-barrel protein [Acetobacteraceae bacterium]
MRMLKTGKSDLVAAGTAVMLAVVTVAQAGAQVLSSLFPEGVPGYDTQPGVTVLSRLRSATEPPGIRLGAFRLAPRFEQAIGFDSNVLGGSARKGSWVIGTRPSLLATSDWSRHALGAYVSLSDTRYLNLPNQSRTDGTVSAGGALDIGRDRLTIAAAHVSTHQDRTQLDALPTDRPVPVRVDDVRASYAISSGRWIWTPNLGAASWHYGDTTILGAPTSQAYRDRDVLTGGLTVRYELSPLRNLVVVMRATGQHYTNPTPGQPSPNSTGYQMLAGLDYDDDAVWRYRLLVGGETRQFSSAAFQPHTAAIMEAEVTWTPTGLTTVRGVLARGMEDAAQQGVAGYTYTTARLRIDHEYMRNVLLHATAQTSHIEFLQGGGRQWGYALGVGVTWLINRSARMSLTHDFGGVQGSHVTTGQVTGDYTRGLTMLTLRLGL